MRLTWLPDVIRAAGLTVVTIDGWQLRGRAFPGSINGIVCHHTATAASAPGDYPSMRIVRDGRSDLPGPLSQLGLGRSGTVYVIASGRANHAGQGGYPSIAGNRDTIGIEAEHPGIVSVHWPTAQLAAYYRLCAALADHLDLPTSRVIGHKEWTPRKVDPVGLAMSEFRRAVQAIRDERDEMAIPRQYHQTLIDLAYAVEHKDSHGSALGFLIDDARKDIITRDELDAALAKIPAAGGTVDKEARAAIDHIRKILRSV